MEPNDLPTTTEIRRQRRDGEEESPRCPDCGAHVFTVGQYTWNTQEYNPEANEGEGEYEWSASDFHNWDGGDRLIGVKCAECDTDLTDLFVQKRWLADIQHDYAVLRRDQTKPSSRAIPLPPAHWHGQHGFMRAGSAHVTSTPTTAQVQFHRQAGTIGAAVASVTFEAPIADLIQCFADVLSQLLHVQEQQARKEHP